MLLLKEFDHYYLWKFVSHRFVEEGHLDMSIVLTFTNLTYLALFFASGEASDITSLEYVLCVLLIV